MSTKFYRDFAHVPTRDLERVVYSLLGIKGTSPTVGLAQVARDYATAPGRTWSVEEVSNYGGDKSAKVNNRVDCFVVEGRDRERVLMIAVLLAFGVGEDFLL